jgi:hypothetical protein
MTCRAISRALGRLIDKKHLLLNTQPFVWTEDGPRPCRVLRQRQKIYRLSRPFVDENGMMRFRASKLDCDGCALKPRCCPNAPARKILRSIHEGARDMARDIAATEAYATSRCERKKIEMLFAHLKRILKLDRLCHRRDRRPRPDGGRRDGRARLFARRRCRGS